MDTARCGCGAVLARGALACSQCHSPVAVAPPPPPADAPVGPNGFLPAPPRPALRVDEREFSRVHEGPLSFGPLGRAVISGLAILPVWFIWFMSGGGLVTLILTVPTALLPLWYVRETWRSHRVR